MTFRDLPANLEAVRGEILNAISAPLQSLPRTGDPA